MPEDPLRNTRQNAGEERGTIKGKASAVVIIDVLLCWGDLVRDHEFWRTRSAGLD